MYTQIILNKNVNLDEKDEKKIERAKLKLKKREENYLISLHASNLIIAN